MSIYTNVVYGMRKCAGRNGGPNYEKARQIRLKNEADKAREIAELTEQLKQGEITINQYKAAQAKYQQQLNDLNSRLSESEGKLSKSEGKLNAGRADYDALLGRLADSEDERNQLIKDKMQLEREAKERTKRHEEFRGNYGALGGQIWENLKKDVSDKYDQAYTWAKAKYAENPELYKQLGFIGGGAIGGGALGALLAGRGNRLVGGTLGAIGGGSAGYLAKVLAKKYGYLS